MTEAKQNWNQGKCEQGAEDRFAVLLATFNGARFLDAQLKSLADQTVAVLDVHVSDDGSSDATRDVLELWAARWSKGRFTITEGPCAGVVENFRSLLLSDDVDADYICFCDQDDVWDPDKLARARAALSETDSPAEKPGLYCGRTRVIGERDEPLGQSPLMSRPPSFCNALVQSIAGGNTMVLDQDAFRLVKEAARRTTFVSHDWWCYLIVTGAGGDVIYDPEPAISYRQHSGNLVGPNTGWKARIRRIIWMLTARFSRWNTLHGRGLSMCRDLLDADARAIMDDFFAARRKGRLALLRTLTRHAIHRQSAFGEVSLYVAAALRRV